MRQVGISIGTTSACAENTLGGLGFFLGRRNYLRVRGEYPTWWGMRGWGVELPPRARRIPVVHDMLGGKMGTTSACAENTSQH